MYLEDHRRGARHSVRVGTSGTGERRLDSSRLMQLYEVASRVGDKRLASFSHWHRTADGQPLLA